LSGHPPKQTKAEGGQQQAKAAGHASAAIQQPNATHSQGSQGCPGTRETRFDCNTVATIANVRQADAAERFNNLAAVEIGIGFITAIAAVLAARWAKRAASAGTKSYEAFVAAEDAFLSVEFPNGTLIESVVDGVRQPDTYFLTALITNVGRTTARVHGCSTGENHIPIQKTLKRDECEELGWRIPLDSLAQFNLRISYTTPIRPKAEMIVTAAPMLTLGNARIQANVVRTRICEQEDGGKRRWWKRKHG